MAFVITQNCCTDASCVSVCPVNCIHPTPDEPDFATAEQLYIDAAACINCGACADACPVDAIAPDTRVEGTTQSVFLELGRTRYEQSPSDHAWGTPVFPAVTSTWSVTDPAAGSTSDSGRGQRAPRPRVAIVGTGPAAAYTAEALLRATDAEITVLDRLPMPGGLVRAGVAPDHPRTRGMKQILSSLFPNPRMTLMTNVEVGSQLTHEDLLAHHHAVVYAVGASRDRELGIPGEGLRGSLAATAVVRWYNADPTVPADLVDLSCERAVLVGTGNVALDIARILTVGTDRLGSTDIADHALDALRHSAVREVVVLGRRGPDTAAWTTKEIVAMRALTDVELVVADGPGIREAIRDAEAGSTASRLQGLSIVPADSRVALGQRRIMLRFNTVAVAVEGATRVEKVLLRTAGGPGRPATEELLATNLVIRAIGHDVAPIDGLPFDEASHRIPHDHGRVVDPGVDPQGPDPQGAYLVGWVKRGATGGIGANRRDAEDTVATIVADLAAGHLTRRVADGSAFDRLVRRVAPQALRLNEIQSIDRAEVRRGRTTGRPRVKHATISEQLADRGRRSLRSRLAR